MKIGIIGSGRIGGTVGKLWTKAGHEVMFSSRHPEELKELVAAAGHNASAGTVAEAAAFCEVVLISVPFGGVEEALVAAGTALNNKALIDTTNQFGPNGLQTFPGGISAAEFNSKRAHGAKLVKAYNTLTAGFQATAAGRSGAERVVMPYVGEDKAAKAVVAGLIQDSGFEPFDVGGWNEASYIEPPRRADAFYGEEWQLASARALLAKLRGY